MSKLTERELVESVRILATSFMELLNHIFQHESDKDFKDKVKKIGEDVGNIKIPKNR